MSQIVKNTTTALATLCLAAFTTAVSADGGDVAALATTVQTQAGAIAKLLNVAAYVAGVGFALAGVLQFKAHKENPQQTPLSKPVVMIIVAAALLFLPAILQIAGTSLGFSQSNSAATYQSPISGN